MIFFLLNKDKKTRIITKHPKEKIINRGKTKSTQRLERRFLKETQENNNHITTDSFTSHLQLRGNRFVTNTHHHERETRNHLEAFPVDNRWTRLIVLSLRDPHLFPTHKAKHVSISMLS